MKTAKKEDWEDITHWRQEQVAEAKEYAAQREKEQVTELLEQSQATSEFKRERRKAEAEEEHERVKDELAEDMAWAAFEEQRVAQADAWKVQYLADQRDLLQEQAQHRREEAAREKEEEDVARAEERSKEMTFMLNSLAAETSELQRSFQLTKQAYEGKA